MILQKWYWYETGTAPSRSPTVHCCVPLLPLTSIQIPDLDQLLVPCINDSRFLHYFPVLVTGAVTVTVTVTRCADDNAHRDA